MSRLSLKFLVSNAFAGSFIGTGGSAIKELIEITDARVTVSSISDVYPGTNERIILISGEPNAVDQAQSLVWEMIALNTRSNGDKTVSWSPKAAVESSDEYEDVSLTGKISLAASAAGMVLGKGGNTLRSISEESGARIQMTTKDEALFTQERIVTISGSMPSCIKCVSQLIAKLSEDLDSAQYVNRGVTYSSNIIPMMGGGMGMSDNRYGKGNRGAASGTNVGAADVDASTTITVTVPDELVGNILGRQGSVMREIMSLSGAKVVVSPREFTDGTRNRTVTITGSPTCAQTAHLYVTQKLQQSSSRPPRRNKQANGNSNSVEPV